MVTKLDKHDKRIKLLLRGKWNKNNYMMMNMIKLVSVSNRIIKNHSGIHDEMKRLGCKLYSQKYSKELIDSFSRIFYDILDFLNFILRSKI